MTQDPPTPQPEGAQGKPATPADAMAGRGAPHVPTGGDTEVPVPPGHRDDDASAQPTTEVAESNEPSPRAFATTTGFVFQIVSVGFLLGSCCAGTLAGWTAERASDPGSRWIDFLASEQRATALGVIILLTTMIGGVGLLAAGIGLQGEHPNSGKLAMIVSGAMTVVLFGLGVFLYIETVSWLHVVVPFGAGAVCAVLFLLAGHSAAILKAHPPPADRNVAPADFVDPLHSRGPTRGK